ncbi:WD40 repeat-like protein [Venustampulla echinocandica]|uniref:DNA damage-binding protein 1 n=1 Tax=Venustampulla echinocandica TaxID=2656787 RepID=A0A370TAB8_9HELO|nr:WD40 repeat-like protein [Venustampulla echinocandica]RDL30758.1 WD40 repeat-like protein [Venustampulla echinocandica]
MSYLAPIHRPSSVRHAIKLKLLDPHEECLVLAKANRVEIWKPTPEGLEMLHSKAIYGRVSMLAKLRPYGAKTDHLFIGTVRFQYFTVAWNPDTQQLDTAQSFEDLTEKYMQESHSVDRCLVDPNGKYLLMELFQGVLSLVKVMNKARRGISTGGYLEGPVQARITELKVRASTLLFTESNTPKLALLFEEGKGKLKLVTYRLVDEKGDLAKFDPKKDRENEIEDLDMGASHLIPVPKGECEQRRYIVRNTSMAKAQLGGVIVVGETKMTYLDDESKAVVQYALEEASIFVAWEPYDDLRYMLADDYGMLHLLTILVDGAVVTGIKVRKLGEISRATVMVHMGNGVVFIGSHTGDSQVIRLDLEAGDQPITILQTLPNIAPILDFAVMDMGSREGETQTNDYSSGQARLVTCSGAHEEGSLRSVRSGVGLEDIGILADLEDVRNLFTLRSDGDSTVDDTLVVSFPTETRVFKFDSQGEVEEIDTFRGLSLDQHILLAMNLPNGLILQVTPTLVSILGLGPSYTVAQWQPPQGQIITAASANDSHVLLSANGTTLVSLDIQQQLREVAVQTLGNGDQVACVHVPADSPNIGVVGFFKSGSLSLLSLNNLQIIHSEDLRRTNNASIPRDIVMTQILSKNRSGPTLFVAMEDGIVLTFNVDKSNFSLSGRKSIVLGTQQARFQVLPREDGLFNVFATCEHPSLIYGSEGSVVYSAVTAENAICVCSFDSEAYPGSIIVATDAGIKVSQIDTERRTHVQTLPMGKTVRRIAYSPNERAFAIGCIKRELIKGEEIITSSFELVEEVLLGELGKPFILEDSNGPELVECVVRAELPISYGDELPAERFIVGTSFLEEDMAQENNVRGRILIFAIDSDRGPYLVHSHVLKGACRRVAVLDGKIVAALVKTVVIYSYAETTEISAELTKLATYRTSTCPIDIDITGNIIAVADMMKSVSLLEYIPGKEGLPDKLTEVARHHEAVWSTAVTQIDEGTYLETDQDGNLLILQRNPNGVTLEDRKSLQLTGDINLGEMVNKVQRINVEPSPNAIVVPKAFLATTEGSIYLISTILPSSQDLLMRLQARMSSTHMSRKIHTLGDMDFNTYRSFKNPVRETAEPFRFVDGELIERFLDFDEEMQEEICEGLGPMVEDVRNVVEELRRLH